MTAQPLAATELAAKIARIERLHAENLADERPSFVRLMEEIGMLMEEIGISAAVAVPALAREMNKVTKALAADVERVGRAFRKEPTP